MQKYENQKKFSEKMQEAIIFFDKVHGKCL